MDGVERYGHISYLVEATPQILKLYPDMTVYVLASDFDAALAREAALREALSEIIVKVQESRSETRRLNWIEGRAQSALEGKPWVKGVFQMPDPKNGKPKEERLSRQLAALREELARVNSAWHDMKQASDIVKQRLTAAEQRNADTVAKLEMAASMMDDDERGNRFAEVCRLAIKSLKPTESGASALDPKIIGIERMPPMEYDEP